MTSRRKDMRSDLDLVLSGELEISKYCATRNISPRTAYIWCLERARSEEEREKVKKWMRDFLTANP